MAKLWYTPVIDDLKRLLAVNLAIELIHFPSTGITSALNHFAEITKNEEEEFKLIIIDFRAAHFSDDAKNNAAEFYRIIASHMQQHVRETISAGEEINLFRQLESVFKRLLKNERKIVINLQNVLFFKKYPLPEFTDLLIFLDRLRDSYNGQINFIISSTYSIFDENTFAPVPLYTKYFNYYLPEWIDSSIKNDVLVKNKIKISDELIDRLKEQSGGLVVLIRSVMRDLMLLQKDFKEIEHLAYDQEFFDTFANTKFCLDRIKQQLPANVITTLVNLAHDKFTQVHLDDTVIKYLKNVGIVDTSNNIRGMILPAYFKLQSPGSVLSGNSKFYQINDLTKVHVVSGEIYINERPNGQYLSGKENEIFRLLFANRHKTIDRDDVAEIMWGSEMSANYSDWAIDKTISRIREKLEDQKPYRIIKTLRGKGFMLV